MSPHDSIRVYCTLFDSRYAARGLAMIASLRKQDPNAEIHALCLDEEAELSVRRIAPEVHVIDLQLLIGSDSAFAIARNNRTQIEWYFTATSVLLNYLLEHRLAPNQTVTYVDADTYFYQSPQPLHQEAVGYSAQIIPHRFPNSLSHLVDHGRFNVGWISVKNNNIGRMIVRDYRTDCLEWCRDQIDGPRFADQKYLDYWVDLYRYVNVSKLDSANVAPWNISNYYFTYDGKTPRIDFSPLIFYHFHGLRDEGGGVYSDKHAYPPAIGIGINEFRSDYIKVIEQYKCLIGDQTPKERLR